MQKKRIEELSRLERSIGRLGSGSIDDQLKLLKIPGAVFRTVHPLLNTEESKKAKAKLDSLEYTLIVRPAAEKREVYDEVKFQLLQAIQDIKLQLGGTGSLEGQTG